MTKNIILGAISIFFIIIFRASGSELVPKDNFVPGWTKSESLQVFVKNELYAHINGGAELFYEFGFEDLMLQRYKNGEREIDIEIYRMESPASALGIYLYKNRTVTPIEGINALNSGNRSQVNIVKSEYFFLINNYSFDESLIPVMINLANRVLEKIKWREPKDLFEYLPKEDLISGSELLIRGKYALQPIFTFGKEGILQLDGEIFGVVGDYKGSGENIYTRLMIPYPDRDYAEMVFADLSDNLDSYLTKVEEWSEGFVFRDYNDKYGIVTLRGAELDIKINLIDKPKK